MKILMVSPYSMHPTNQGSRIRIRTLFTAIRDQGHDIDFLNVMHNDGDIEEDRAFVGADHYYQVTFDYNHHPGSLFRHYAKKFTDRQHLFFLNNRIDDYCPDSVLDYAVKLDRENDYDVIWVEYVFLSKVFSRFGNDKLKVLDTHDRFTDRYKPFMDKHETYRWFSVSAAEEEKGLGRADVVIAIQDAEAVAFKEVLTDRVHVCSIGHKVDLDRLPLGNSHRMLFLASGIDLNVRMIKKFAEEVYPQVKRRVADAELLLAGGICKKVDFDDPGIRKLGYVDQLADGYGQADIFVNPIEFGTGLKIKCVEALGYGRALVTTPEGAKGLDSKKGENFIVVDEPYECVNEIVRLMNEPSDIEELSNNGYEYAKKLNRYIDRQVEQVLMSHSKPMEIVQSR